MAIPDSVESGSCTCELFDGTDFRPIPESPSVHRPIADPIVTTIPPGKPNLSPLRSSPLLLARLSPSSSQAQQQQWMECGPDKETPRVGVTRRCCRAFFQITLFNNGDPRRNRQPGPLCVAFVWVLIGGAEFPFFISSCPSLCWCLSGCSSEARRLFFSYACAHA